MISNKVMKKIIRSSILMIAVFMLLTGCQSAKPTGSGDDKSLQEVLDKGELILGLDDSFPPMGYKDENNNIVGFDIDTATEVCNKLGIKLKLQPIDWDAKEQELATGNIDCIWNGLSYDKERDEKMQLSEPYMKNRQITVVLAESPYQTLADLAGKRVVVQNGSTASGAVEDNTDFKASLKEVIKVSDNVQAMMDLKVSGSDAVVMDEVVARFYTEKEPDTYRLIEESLADENYVIAFRKGDAALCNKVNDTLKELKKDGALKSVAEKWFSEDITTVQ